MLLNVYVMSVYVIISGDHEENINPEVAKKVKDAAKRLEIQLWKLETAK
jgi:hypothetical protein